VKAIERLDVVQRFIELVSDLERADD